MPLLDLIRTYRPIDADDARIRAQFIAFVTRYPDCLERSLVIGHITASAWVIDPTGTRLVMVHHRKLARWLQPGGHADGCSEVESVARREVQEETGLADLVLVDPVPFDLDIHPIPEYRGVRAHEHFDVRFAFQTSGSQTLQLSDESHDVAWIPIDRLEAYDPDPSILRMRDKWIKTKGSG